MPSLSPTLRHLFLPCALALSTLLGACGEAEDGIDDLFDDAAVTFDSGQSGYDAGYPAYDASPIPGYDASIQGDATVGYDGGSSGYDASSGSDASSADTGIPADLGGLGGLGDLGGLGGLLGGGATDAGAAPDASTGNPGKGELDPNGAINPNLPPKADNPKECPSLAPPNPVGNCLGLPIYVGCGYGKPGGQQLSCTCDWYHWLCI